MATCHNAIPQDDDARLLITSTSLGAPTERFDEYERDVRREYRWVSTFLYRRGRAKVLREFAAREFIYSTVPFRREREQRARDNIDRSLRSLGRAG